MTEETETGQVLSGFLLPGLPHPLLCAEKNPGWMKIKKAYDIVRQRIFELKPDLLVIYSTFWPSVIGHQIQADPSPEWTLVDEQFHNLGSIPYKLRMDAEFANEYSKTAQARGLQSRAINYKGFPIDTGSVVALKQLTPKNEIPAVIVSSNVYADRAETIVLGKAARETLVNSKKNAVGIIVSSLSNRLLPLNTLPKEDRIHSLKDQEWNQKLLEFLSAGRLEDVSQLSRQVHREARVQKVNNFKPFWWLASFMGQNNYYTGDVLAYEAIHGTGAAVVELKPSAQKALDLEYDEDDPEAYEGERNVLGDKFT